MRRGQRPRCWNEDTCEVCPAQVLGAGEFDVADRPGRRSRYEPTLGYRVSITTAAPVCVHPFRVGLPAGPYASANVPVPDPPAQPPAPASAHLELPDELVDLEAWFVAMLRVVPTEAMASALARAEA